MDHFSPSLYSYLILFLKHSPFNSGIQPHIAQQAALQMLCAFTPVCLSWYFLSFICQILLTFTQLNITFFKFLSVSQSEVIILFFCSECIL